MNNIPKKSAGFLDDIHKGVTLKKADDRKVEVPSNLNKKPMSFLDEISKGVKLNKPNERKVEVPSNIKQKPMSFLDEISKGVKLKKQELNADPFDSKNVENNFKQPAEELNTQNINKSLMGAIQMRGFQLNKNNVSDDESEGSDSWSD